MADLVDTMFTDPTTPIICKDLEERVPGDAADDLLMTMETHGQSLTVLLGVGQPKVTLREMAAHVWRQRTRSCAPPLKP